MLTARDIMNTNVIKVRENDTLKKLAELFLTHHISGAPVVDENCRLVGVVNESDLIFTTKKIDLPRTIAILDAFFFLDSPEKMEKEMKKIAGSKVIDICTDNPVTVTPATTLEEVGTIMTEQKIHTLPVIEEGILVGIIGKTDIIKTMVQRS